MKIASWNINSVRVRIEQLLVFLKEENIDVMLLQETKCIDEAFPREVLEDYGYNIAIFGEKTYNGVAILSKYRLEEVISGVIDKNARYIEALISGYTIASVYVPNGVSPELPQYEYKLFFLDKLEKHIQKYTEKFIIGGDFNITLTDDDVYDPFLWKGKICCTDKERSAIFRIMENCCLTDSVRTKYKNNEKIYSWWNYRVGGLKKNQGLRLDYLFTSEDIVIRDVYISKRTRELSKPSDHAPIVIDI